MQGESVQGQGTSVRLSVAIPVALLGSWATALLRYALPLYFAARSLPNSAWETWSFYSLPAWIVAAPVAGVLGHRVGERRLWSASLAAGALLSLWLIFLPFSDRWPVGIVGVGALVMSATAASNWVAGVSLFQTVPARSRGWSNSAMLAAYGVGAILGPILGSLLLRWSAGPQIPVAADFFPILGVFAGMAALCALAMFRWGERGNRGAAPAGAQGPPSSSRHRNLRLLRSARYLSLVIPLSLLAGPIFTANNAYLVYRAHEPRIGLIVGSQDRGWGALQIVSFAAQLAGSLVLVPLAGRKISVHRAAVFVALFALACLGIGLAPGARLLFLSAAVFEVGRQFTRWVQTGYVSEHFTDSERTLVIAFSVSLSCTGSFAFMLVMKAVQSPDAPGFHSALPFFVAAGIGLAGAALLSLRRETLASPTETPDDRAGLPGAG
ncbi:MAG: MFS transporter [Planctomycetota bacterium]